MGSLSELPQVSPGGTVEGGRGDGALGTLRDPYAWGTRSQLQRETFSTRPSAAQGAGSRFAEGRRISQLFSLCPVTALKQRPAAVTVGTEAAAGRRCGLTHQRPGFAHAASRVHIPRWPRGSCGRQGARLSLLRCQVRPHCSLSYTHSPCLPTEVPRGGTYVLSPGWRMAACGSKAWTLLPVQSTASPPPTVLQKSRSFIEPHPPARGTSDPNSRSLASPCRSLFEMLKVWACCCLWVRPRLVCGSPSTAQCGFHRAP